MLKTFATTLSEIDPLTVQSLLYDNSALKPLVTVRFLVGVPH